MGDTTLVLSTICVFIVIFLAVWFEYKNSHCQYGGSNSGRNNWLLQLIKDKVKAIAKKRSEKIEDVCDY